MKFHPNHATVLSEVLAIKLLPVINCEFSRDTESADDLLAEKLSVADVIVATGLASIHLVK
jgi:hypothetical protein